MDTRYFFAHVPKTADTTLRNIIDKYQPATALNQEELPSERGILYMHLPKASGTSLTVFLEAHYPSSKVALHIENHIHGKQPHEVSGLEDKLLLTAHLKRYPEKGYPNRALFHHHHAP